MEGTDWLSATKDRLNLCSDVRGDRHAIEAQLHKVQEIWNTVEAGHKKLSAVLEKGNKVLPETSAQGQELVKQELDMLSGEFKVLDTDLQDLLNLLGESWNSLIPGLLCTRCFRPCFTRITL